MRHAPVHAADGYVPWQRMSCSTMEFLCAWVGLDRPEAHSIAPAPARSVHRWTHRDMIRRSLSAGKSAGLLGTPTAHPRRRDAAVPRGGGSCVVVGR